jgi:prolyl-tRNA synthetase
MSKQPASAIKPTRKENYPEWYQEVVKAADLAEHSPVRGCMIIKPWGYAIWENMQKALDGMIKKTGHQNAYFPLFIPLSYLEKEAQHVDGFAKECAVVTHHRLEKGKDGKLVPAGPLEEPLIVRPTSEMIIGEAFSRWVQSYRDLPVLINQWANIVRWEMRTRLFLRTTEFLWQEGHTAHATADEAIDETKKMLGVYTDFVRNYLAVPVIEGMKTANERFPGAVDTYCIEAMMQDGKALQAGTSHFLGQNFAKSCDIKFQDESGALQHAWTTSWGSTTRLIGALVMTHSDDDGLVLPPKVAPKHIVLLPVLHAAETRAQVLKYCEDLQKELSAVHFDGHPLEVIIDTRDIRGGEKNWSWIKKGIPIRVEVGAREAAAGNVSVFRRDKPHKEALVLSKEEFAAKASALLKEMQTNLLKKATEFRESNTKEIHSKKDLYDYFNSKGDMQGFALCHYHEDGKLEDQLKEELNVTVRCFPLHMKEENGKCVLSGKESRRKAIFAKSY